MKRFSWVLTAPITLAILVLAVNNRHDVTLEVWPFGIQLDYPLYLIILISIGVGVFIGALIAWLSSGKTRKKARQAEWQALDLQRELAWERGENQKEREKSQSRGQNVTSA
ncbi:LapA family protein [Kiloniella sp.]|uniref:LapA family protein n=1 Tax=Kiloniella sp. TaxID=1938587 RepID=UPI003B013AF2